MTFRRLLVDAGPLIALFYEGDKDHTLALQGFQELNVGSTRVLAPLPIIFEVYKWLLYRVNGVRARGALERMQGSLDITSTQAEELVDIVKLVTDKPLWNGSLEDATVVMAARRYACPLWTFNYRDFAAFNDLEFWNPGPQT